MDWLISFWSEFASLIAEYGLLTVAPIVVLTSAGVPLPVPTDLLVVLIGVQAREGQHPLWWAWLVLSASMFVGAALMYELARWIGTGALGDIARYGRYIGLTERRLEAAEARIRNDGRRAIFLARFVPVLKTVIVVACGTLAVPRRMYLPAMGLAALVYIGFQLALGFLFGPPIILALEQIVIPFGLVVPLAMVGILLIWLVRARRDVDARATRPTLDRKSRVQAGALAGALAIAGSTLTVNALIYVGGPLAEVLLTAPGSVVALALRFPVELLYVLTSIAFVTVLGVFSGALYGAIEHRFGATWPDWLHGISFAVLPLIASLVLLTPLVLLERGAPRATWLVAAVAEAMWWTMYGGLLGWIYPLFRGDGADRNRAHE